MIITYYGLEFFKVQFGDLVIGFNPRGGKGASKTTRFGADIGFVTLPHEDFSSVENLSHGGKNPFTIINPGEYETKGVFIRGFGTKTNYDKEETHNTVYILTLEDMKICFLGALGNATLPPEAKEHMEGIHVLFIPIGGGDVLEAPEAYKLAISLDAKIIIPMHYEGAGGEGALKTFLKEGGSEKIEALDKLTIKKKDVEGKEGEIVVLSPQ